MARPDTQTKKCGWRDFFTQDVVENNVEVPRIGPYRLHSEKAGFLKRISIRSLPASSDFTSSSTQKGEGSFSEGSHFFLQRQAYDSRFLSNVAKAIATPISQTSKKLCKAKPYSPPARTFPIDLSLPVKIELLVSGLAD